MVYLPHFPISSHKSISRDSCEKLLPILEKLGNPQNRLPPVIQIAGTNGKGSTAAFLASIFKCSGYKAHVYTSPHIHHCNERIVIAGNQIDDNYLYEMLEEVRLACDELNQNSYDINLTLFEGLTLAALLAFSKNPADICIIETGMGGRVDATNVIDRKIATILTSISLDHQEFLGDNLFSIACEKSYIMREGVPCIISPQSDAALLAIETRSKEIKNPLIIFNRDFGIKMNDDETFNFQNSNGVKFDNLSKPSLLGWHQYLNASLAIGAVSLLKDFNISKENISAGLKEVNWASRLEKLPNKILDSNDELWIDGAHNQSGFEVLSDWISDKIIEDSTNEEPKRNYLIVGFTNQKSKPELFIPFKDIIDFICTVRVDVEPSPESAEAILEKVLASGVEEVVKQDDLEGAIKFLKNLDKKNPCRIVICGSLYLAREARKITS
ncbi:MAG: dihydrofolate synthase/folylpolyglutamate synthase [Rickettsiales bacterium]|jgi:dihydrofolate synthase/folylpolyglutamate synthase